MVVFTGLIVARIVTAADSVHMKNTTELAGDDVFSLVGFVPAGLPTPGNPFGGDDIKWSEQFVCVIGQIKAQTRTKFS